MWNKGTRDEPSSFPGLVLLFQGAASRGIVGTRFHNPMVVRFPSRPYKTCGEPATQTDRTGRIYFRLAQARLSSKNPNAETPNTGGILSPSFRISSAEL
jgi:hypothetical protein